MSELLGTYKNGNYIVMLFNDGTKIKKTINKDDNEFISEFPESMDMKITNYCDMGCKFCHEKSTTNGKHGDIMNLKFIDTIKPFTEIAIGGGNPLDHPQLIDFLKKLKSKDIIPNLTVNQGHFFRYKETIDYLLNEKLIYGLGISVNIFDKKLIEEIQNNPLYKNVVLHLIIGVISNEDFSKLFDRNLKILLLGYKDFGRGENYKSEYTDVIENRINYVRENLDNIFKNFKVTSFDNLSLKQLSVQNHLNDKVWERMFMGDDGTHTMYIDGINEEYTVSSTTKERYNLLDDIIPMFEHVKDIHNNKIKEEL